MQTFALWLYGIFSTALTPLVRIKLRRRAKREPLYGKYIEERFGQFSQAPSKGWIWIHAVSLGETIAAGILLQTLRKDLPAMRLLLTHGTATGRAEGQKLLREGDIQVWQPWDSPKATESFFTHFKPKLGILMETEVWPMLCARAAQFQIPLVLTNARLSEKSARAARRLAWLSRPAYASFSQVLAQTQADAQRLINTGAPETQTQVLGNIKFDVEIDSELQTEGKRIKEAQARPILMLAVSREGEEALFLKAFSALSQAEYARKAIKNIANPILNNIQILIVPRHPQRFDEVAQLCLDAGLSISRRTDWHADGAQIQANADVLIGDSLGEMPLYYALADVALLGGSFAPLGGQNLIQSIACGCPIVMGQHTFNFKEACETAVSLGAAKRAEDMVDALRISLHLLQNKELLTQMNTAGAAWLATNQGAAERMSDSIKELVLT